MYLKIGQKYPAVVTEFKQRGVVVRLEDGSTKFIHLSKISDEYVKDCQDYLTLNEKYEVECVESSVRPFELSFLHLKLKKRNRYFHVAESAKVDNEVAKPVKRVPYKKPEVWSKPVKSQNSAELYESADSRLEAMIAASNKAFRDKTGLEAGRVSKNRRKGHYK